MSDSVIRDLLEDLGEMGPITDCKSLNQTPHNAMSNKQKK